MKSEYVLVSVDDWSGLYRNGNLAMEGHSIRFEEAMELCVKHRPVFFEVLEANLEWLADRGNLPARLRDVKLACGSRFPLGIKYGDFNV